MLMLQMYVKTKYYAKQSTMKMYLFNIFLDYECAKMSYSLAKTHVDKRVA